jgi:hypothetical protein
MRVLVDTNILLRSAQSTHPLCSQAASTVANLLRQKDASSSAPRTIAEFWNVATRPAEVDGLGFTQEEAFQEVAGIENLLTLLPDIPAIYPGWTSQRQPARPEQLPKIDAIVSRAVEVRPIRNPQSPRPT